MLVVFVVANGDDAGDDDDNGDGSDDDGDDGSDGEHYDNGDDNDRDGDEDDGSNGDHDGGDYGGDHDDDDDDHDDDGDDYVTEEDVENRDHCLEDQLIPIQFQCVRHVLDMCQTCVRHVHKSDAGAGSADDAGSARSQTLARDYELWRYCTLA